MRWSYLTSGMTMRGVDTTRTPWKTKKEPPRNNFWRELYDYMTIWLHVVIAWNRTSLFPISLLRRGTFVTILLLGLENLTRDIPPQPLGTSYWEQGSSETQIPTCQPISVAYSYLEVQFQLWGGFIPTYWGLFTTDMQNAECRMVPPVISWFINPIDYLP